MSQRRRRQLRTVVCLTVASLCLGTALVSTARGQQSAMQPAQDAPSTAPATAPVVAPSGPIAPAPSSSPGASSTSPDDAPELMLFKEMPVVVAAAKREQTQQEAAASVNVMTAEQIDLLGYRSLADVLGNQRSFYLHTDGLNWFAGVRGFLRPGEWNARLLVTVDGRPTRETIYSQTHLDQDFVVPMEAVKQIEIVRGPGSALYGTNAVFGVVNVVTKDGADINGLQVRAEGGSEQTVRGSALWGAVLPGDWDVVGAVTGYSSQGDGSIHYDGIHDAAHNFGDINHSDYEGVESAFLKIHKGEFTATLDYESRQKDNRSATYLTSWFDPGAMHEERGNVTLRWDHTIAAGQSIHAMAHFGDYLYNQYLPFGNPGETIDHYYTLGHDNWVGEEVHYDWQATQSLHFTFGADSTESLIAQQFDHDTQHGTILNIPASTNHWGLFTEAELKVAPKLTLTGGIRMDDTQRVGFNFSPRLAAVFSATKADTFKALYGRAFRAPNLYEELYASPGQNAPNPNLKSELADTYELVWERQHAPGLRTILDGFYWEMHDAMENTQLADGSLQTRNGATESAYGVEGEVQKEWVGDSSLRAYATYTWAASHGSELTQSPRWTVGGALIVPLFNRRLDLAVRPQFVGAMKSDLGAKTDPTFITNVVLTSKDIFKGWDLQAGAYNLFANSARLPRDGAFNQSQPTLNYPDTLFLFSVTHRF